MSLRPILAVVALAAATEVVAAQLNCRGSGPGELRTLEANDVHNCLKRGVWIEFAKLQGRDVIAVLPELRVPVRIFNSKIDGGLAFSDLEPVPSQDAKTAFDALMASKDKDTKLDSVSRRVPWSRMYRSNYSPDKVRVVPVGLVLKNCGIGHSEDRDVENNPVSVSATRTVFFGDVDLSGAELYGGVQFGRASFLGRAMFEHAIFQGRVTFDGAFFGGKASFKDARFKTTTFEYSRFEGDANFQSAQFNQAVLFKMSRLCRGGNFLRANFSNGARFTAMRAAGDVIFKEAQFPKGRSSANPNSLACST